MSLSCPACQQAMRVVKGPDDLEVDVCRGCGGTWFDAGELSQRGANLPGDLPSALPEEPRQCPRCHTSMPAAVVRGVEIDLCVVCDGVFLDQGELERLRHLTRNIPPGQRKSPSLAEQGPLEPSRQPYNSAEPPSGTASVAGELAGGWLVTDMIVAVVDFFFD